MVDVYQQTGVDFFSSIKDIIEKKIDHEVRRADSFDIPEDAYDAMRKQHHALKIIETIAARHRPNSGFNLCLLHDDIYIDRMNFVFGLADPRINTAVVSSFRLNGTHLIDRLVKEIVHELGHLMGLGHCADLKCVMHFSNTLSDTDQKSADLCTRCRSING
ncbi:MAG: archaemetzincin family Zn-dependent metalloprotease [candidate division WOR-3 bacterium]|nr:MAG: archaemetzincin family Zn-dependent metalloprotease [candidate division WOR-3 bacterium]